MNTDKTLVIQSHRHPLPYPWLEKCLASVRQWAASRRWHYQFIDDELFDYIPAELIKQTCLQKVIATDLARLRVIQNYLNDYMTVIWCDADFLIFNPARFDLTDAPFALGREVWIQENDNQLKAYIKVHNAFLMFRKGNSFLDFYADTAENLLRRNTGSMPPQFVGPKLLTALHNIVQCPVMETAGMLSPLVIRDIAHHSGPALELFLSHCKQPVYAANLCASLCAEKEDFEKEIEIGIEVLLNKKMILQREFLS